MACRILVPQLGIKHMPPALEAQSLNHWMTREALFLTYFLKKYAIWLDLHKASVCVLLVTQSYPTNCFVTPWTVALKAPLSMEFSRQEYWSV